MAPQRPDKPYTTQLQAGLGLVAETKTLLELWSPGQSAAALARVALASGRFPTVSARRLNNIVTECFGPRYLTVKGAPLAHARRVPLAHAQDPPPGESPRGPLAPGVPAAHLKVLAPALTTADFRQLLLLYTCRAQAILGDFVRQVYWARYAGGYPQVTNEDARAFVERGIDDGKTVKRWSESTVQRVAAYLTGCCADYGLLEPGPRTSRQILPFRIAPAVAAYLAHELHFAGVGDNALLTHSDWQLFGLAREEVREEIKRLSRQGLLIVQAAGEAVRISWQIPDLEALCDVLAQG